MRRGYSREYAVEHIDGLVDIARREIAAWPLARPMPAVPALQRIVTDQVGTLVAGVSPRPYNDDLVCYVHGLLSATMMPRPYPALVAALPPRLKRRWTSSITR